MYPTTVGVYRILCIGHALLSGGRSPTYILPLGLTAKKELQVTAAPSLAAICAGRISLTLSMFIGLGRNIVCQACLQVEQGQRGTAPVKGSWDLLLPLTMISPRAQQPHLFQPRGSHVFCLQLRHFHGFRVTQRQGSAARTLTRHAFR